MNNLSTFDDCDCICHSPEGQHLGCFPYCAQCGMPSDLTYHLPENKVEKVRPKGHFEASNI